MISYIKKGNIFFASQTLTYIFIYINLEGGVSFQPMFSGRLLFGEISEKIGLIPKNKRQTEKGETIERNGWQS